MRALCSTFLIIIALTSMSTQYSSTIPVTAGDSASKYFEAAIQAADWISSFQVTPLSSNWGIPYPDQRTWGLDPFYYSNGTITADTNGIIAGSKQQQAFLIAGHDAGEGSYAALDAYLVTHDPKYLEIFQVYYDYFVRSQFHNNLTQSSNQTALNGYWPEQASVQTGPDRVFGTSDDQVQLVPAFPAAEHGNPIAAALIAYYRLVNDSTTLNMLNRYGNWLIHDQIQSGEYSGAFPVTQYYSTIGWKPRMFETTESAWILCELYMISGNRTYLNAAVAAGRYMISRQFNASSDTRVDGALPYEWNRTNYNRSVSTNHAGFALLAWIQLYRLTDDNKFLAAVRRYADWLLSYQVTTASTPWGDHTYSNDSMAIGGYYYGYDTDRHTFGWRVALSLWSAAYAIPGLILLSQVTGDQKYLQSSELAAEWLAKMRFTDQLLIPLQSLAIIKYVVSSWWGLYPQFYQPSMEEVQKSGIIEYVNQVQSKPQSATESNLTWFEQTFNVSFNQIDYRMASRGPQYMKMIWSWWPSVGFEPRYGGDVAFGQFSMANYLKYNETIDMARAVLQVLLQQTNNTQIPYNLTRSAREAEELLNQAMRDYNDGWFSIAAAKLENATNLAKSLINIIAPLAESTQLIQNEITVTVVVLSALLVATNYYWYNQFKKSKRVRKGRPGKTKAS